MPRRKVIIKSLPRHILPPSPQLTRYLLRLSKPSLEKVVFDWLKAPICTPNFTPTKEDLQYVEDPQDLTVDEAEEAYRELKSRQDIVERVFEREWREGLTMHQIAQVDVQYLLDHPSSQKWTASQLVLDQGDKPLGDKLPKFDPFIFTHSLIETMKSMVQCHPYYISHPTLPLTLVRLSLHNPAPLPTSLPPSNQVIYLAIPHASPYIFLTPQRSKLADICRKSLPIALSSKDHRFELMSTALSAKTLEALIAKKGAERGSIGASAAWSIYGVEGGDAVDGNPLELLRPRSKRPLADEDMPANKEEADRWKRRRVAEARFGKSAIVGDGAGLERVEVYLREQWPRVKPLQPGSGNAGRIKERSDKGKGKVKGKGKGKSNREDSPEVDEDLPWKGKTWVPNIDIVLEGNHVFAGVRTLVEEGIVDGEKLPTWMTGEEGKSVGMVKRGTIVQRSLVGRDEERQQRR